MFYDNEIRLKQTYGIIVRSGLRVVVVIVSERLLKQKLTKNGKGDVMQFTQLEGLIGKIKPSVPRKPFQMPNFSL